MRVAHIGKFYPPHWGGMETALKDLCEVLAPRVDLEAAVASDSRERIDEIVGGVRLSRLPNLGTFFSQPLVRGLRKWLRQTQADLVHLHEPNPLAMVQFLLSGSRAPLVIHYHSDIVRQRRLRWLYRPWLEAGLARAAAIIVGSQELLDSSPVLARWRHKCEVVPFGIDLAPFLAIERTSPGPDSSAPLHVLAVGRLAYYKGFHYLIDAVRSLPGVRLTIAGEGPERSRLEALILANGLTGRVTLAGRLTEAELLDHYRRAHLFCLPSCERAEAFGLVQLEAMGAGLAVISTDLPTGMRAINRHGETGLVVPPHNPAALAAAISTLAAQPLLRRTMGQAARARARTLFSRDVMGSRVLNLYRQLVPGGKQEVPL